MPINYANYPPNWKTEIRPVILEREGNCCKFCTVPNYALIERTGPDIHHWRYWPEGMESESHTLDGHKSVKIILTIAHLDHNIQNNDYSNLAALCQRCHNRHDIDYRKANRLKNKQKSQLPLL